MSSLLLNNLFILNYKLEFDSRRQIMTVDPKKEEGKVYHIVLAETLTLTSGATFMSSMAATGSLGQYDKYYEEAWATVQKSRTAGTMSPSDISSLEKTLGDWRTLSEGYYTQILDLTKKNENKQLILSKVK